MEAGHRLVADRKGTRGFECREISVPLPTPPHLAPSKMHGDGAAETPNRLIVVVTQPATLLSPITPGDKSMLDPYHGITQGLHVPFHRNCPPRCGSSAPNAAGPKHPRVYTSARESLRAEVEKELGEAAGADETFCEG